MCQFTSLAEFRRAFQNMDLKLLDVNLMKAILFISVFINLGKLENRVKTDRKNVVQKVNILKWGKQYKVDEDEQFWGGKTIDGLFVNFDFHKLFFF